MRYFIGSVLILLTSMFSQAGSFPLRNEFYILNASKRVYDISYIVCGIRHVSNKQYNKNCDFDSSVRLAAGQSMSIEVDENDNYSYGDDNYFVREIYLYQVTSQASEGTFLRGEEDYKNYSKDHGNDLAQGYVSYCAPTRAHSVILDDFGTNRVYCHGENYNAP